MSIDLYTRAAFSAGEACRQKIKDLGIFIYHANTDLKISFLPYVCFVKEDEERLKPEATTYYFLRRCTKINVISLTKFQIRYINNYMSIGPVRSSVPMVKSKKFMKIKFLNKVINAINLLALLRSTSIINKIPNFRDKEPPIVPYKHTKSVASKFLNFASILANLKVSDYLSNL